MTGSGLLQIALYLAVLLALVRPLGTFMARVYQGENTWISPMIAPVERLVYRVAGIDPSCEQD